MDILIEIGVEDDECGLARHLIASGQAQRSDRLVTTRNGVRCMSGSMGWFADHYVEESARISPRFRKWRPYSRDRLDRPARVCGEAVEARQR